MEVTTIILTTSNTLQSGKTMRECRQQPYAPKKKAYSNEYASRDWKLSKLLTSAERVSDEHVDGPIGSVPYETTIAILPAGC